MKIERYNTNLASEYYVLSMLYRLGFDAYLTLGNKKSVDIIIEKGNDILTIENEQLKVLNIDKLNSRIRVLREQNSTVGTSHSAYSTLYS